jgi:hypothetical protein
VHNLGNRPVDLDRVLSDDGHFSVSFTGPVSVPAGGTSAVDVTFLPDDLATFTGSIRLDADTTEASAEVPVVGVGADGPVAVCSATPQRVDAIRGAFQFTGAGSSDPGGRPISYRWAWVSVPRGSTVATPLAGQTTASITPDVVGNYVAELVVTNDLGYDSAPCRATATADADRDLWVEMYWDNAEDVDLHLLRNNGTFASQQDCFFDNCIGGLSWDAPGIADDPFLDLDDTTGVGPENINIDQPAANRYTVLIHDHPFRQYQGANNVTVNVYVYGRLEFQDVRTVTGEGDRVEVVEIDWTTQPPRLTRL